MFRLYLSRINVTQETRYEKAFRWRIQSIDDPIFCLNRYIVNEGKNGKSYWRDVGAVWPHKNGNGFDITIYEGLAVSGRIVCTEPKQKEEPQQE